MAIAACKMTAAVTVVSLGLTAVVTCQAQVMQVQDPVLGVAVHAYRQRSTLTMLNMPALAAAVAAAAAIQALKALMTVTVTVM